MNTDHVIDHYGGHNKAAREIKTSPQMLSKWVKSGHIPKKDQIIIMLISKRELMADKAALEFYGLVAA